MNSCTNIKSNSSSFWNEGISYLHITRMGWSGLFNTHLHVLSVNRCCLLREVTTYSIASLTTSSEMGLSYAKWGYLLPKSIYILFSIIPMFKAFLLQIFLQSVCCEIDKILLVLSSTVQKINLKLFLILIVSRREMKWMRIY